VCSSDHSPFNCIHNLRISLNSSASNTCSLRTNMMYARLVKSTARAVPCLANLNGVSVSAQSTRSYDKKVIEHYENPKNVGSFDKNDADVGTGLVGAPACGDVMKLQIKVDENGRICDARFKTFGCASAIASSSFATEFIKGKLLDEAAEVKNTVIAKELKLPPVKLHCSMLAEDAIKAAIQNYKKGKQSNTDASN
jgi:Fe-S cluster assembly scaffold IscU